MAEIIHGVDGRDVYPAVLNRVRRAGVRRESRNGLTYNLSDVVIALDSPLNALPLDLGRNLNPRIAAFEALQLIGAFSNPERLIEIASAFKRYLEPNGYFHGAYGERIGEQAAHVVDKLKSDQHSRQAVISLWDPQLDNEPGKFDYPCTVAIGVSLEPSFTSNKLNMRVSMRSNDAWLGLPYDMFQFTQLQLTLCNVLDAYPGSYVHNAWSLHLYDTDVEKSYNVTHTPESIPGGTLPCGIGNLGDSMEDVYRRARVIGRGGSLGTSETESETWYVDTLKS